VSASNEELISEGRRVLALEAAAVAGLQARLDEAFAHACRLVAEASGRVIVSGLGKSGHVARKLAATLSSTGTPAVFLHAAEALHGDLGIVGPHDVAILVTKSAEGAELGGLVDYLIRLGVPLVLITGQPASPLARHADAVLDASVAEEACPFDLAPTTSTTAALALGDALAMGVLLLEDFHEEDFARLHPAGALGRKLTLRVADVMVADEYPWLGEDATMRDAIGPLAEKRGTVPVLDGDRRIVGVLTAGDLTRLMEREADFLDHPVKDVMTRSPKTTETEERASAAVRRMETHGIMALPVRDPDGTLVGIVHLHDLLRSGAV
jgi:arabinose-5-phosphate isomerase